MEQGLRGWSGQLSWRSWPGMVEGWMQYTVLEFKVKVEGGPLGRDLVSRMSSRKLRGGGPIILDLRMESNIQG